MVEFIVFSVSMILLIFPIAYLDGLLFGGFVQCTNCKLRGDWRTFILPTALEIGCLIAGVAVGLKGI